MTLIRRDSDGARRVDDDPWRTLEDDEPASATGDVLVSLSRWAREGPALRGRQGRVGVLVPGDTDPEEVDLGGAALVAVQFAKFTDGRGYSLARVLRDRVGYEGELRAVGHVLRDQLFYLARCGFDTFDLFEDDRPADAQLEDALAAFRDFSVTYQPAADHDLPIWRRRAP